MGWMGVSRRGLDGAVVLLLGLLCVVRGVHAELLVDRNGDGAVSCLAFGDSITFGIGDSEEGFGYPGRLSGYIGIPVRNEGVPGERLIEDGLDRLPGLVAGSDSDVVLLLEGTNDSFQSPSPGAMRRAYQRSINVIRALGREALIGSPVPTCCERAGLNPILEGYAGVARSVAAQNEIVFIDFRRAWLNSCRGVFECELFELPTGLHPNERGYTVMAQTAAAAILGIDVFAPGGAATLEEALGLLPGEVIVVPDEVSVMTEGA